MTQAQIHFAHLQDGLTDMANFAHDVASRSSEVEADTKRDRIILASRRWRWETLLSQPSLQDHQNASRLSGLQRMGDVFMGAIKYLQETAARVGTAKQACAMLQQRLLEDEMRLGGGVDATGTRREQVPEWVNEQIMILAKGGKGLRREVDEWRVRKRRFVKGRRGDA